MELTLATYGFFVLPMRGAGCVSIVAPATAATSAAHRTELMIEGMVAESSVAGVRPGRHHATTLDLTGRRLTFGPAAPAATSHFELIVDLDDLFCDGVFERGYSAGGHVDAVVELAGGTIRAAADRYTANEKWSFQSCGGATVTGRRLTSLVVYELPTWTGRLEVAPLDPTAAPAGYVRFSGGAVSLALRCVPLSGDVQSTSVNTSHIEATLPLLSGPATVNRSHSRRPAPTADVPRASISAHAAVFLGLDGDVTRRRDPIEGGTGGFDPPTPPPVPFEGDPHCSMRKAALPKWKGAGHLDDVVTSPRAR